MGRVVFIPEFLSSTLNPVWACVTFAVEILRFESQNTLP